MEGKFKTTSHVTETNIPWFQYCVSKRKIGDEPLDGDFMVSSCHIICVKFYHLLSL